MKTHTKIIQEIESLLPEAFPRDRFSAGRTLGEIKRLSSGNIDEKQVRELTRLKNRLRSSVNKRKDRKSRVPEPSFDPALPITIKKDEIIAAIKSNRVVIISGETGSGKSTQLPKFCLAAGRGVDGKIGCTQPRRIAAISVAQRVTFEMGQSIGQSVGYKIRFTDMTAKDAYIKFMTDGIMLAETRHDPLLNEYDTIIIDEAHERSLNIDFILGFLKKLLKKRKDLKLIITSATLDTEKFSKTFDTAPVIEVSGRMYPVEVRYITPENVSGDLTYIETAVFTVDKLVRETGKGDILVFMPTEQDIRETAEMMKAGAVKNIRILPLFARLPASEQTKIFSKSAARKIIIATNIAETSITIPGIKYVVDAGLARISHYSPRSRTTSLPVEPVSKSSADQRKGRCGRVENGICIRLYSEEDYHSRPLYTPPEILRANLAEVILRMIDLKLGNISDFPFVDRPAEKSIRDGFNLLTELGAIDEDTSSLKGKQKTPYVLTDKGKLMAKIPLDPRLSRVLIEAKKRGCLEEISVLASALSLQDPRERPAENKADADKAHEKFQNAHSDFMTLLNIWQDFNDTCKKTNSAGISMNQMKKYCRENYLSFKRMREWRDIYFQITAILREQKRFHHNLQESKIAEAPTGNNFTPRYTAIHKAILSGFLSNIAEKKEKNIFSASKSRQAMIFPGSSIFNKAGSWIVAAEMVETTRLFARIAADIDPEWLEEPGGSLCRYTYLNPHWEKGRSEVVAEEHVTLFGLVIVSGRTAPYGPVNPEEATELFIRNALVPDDVKERLPFLIHNQQLIHELENMENRLRKKNILVSEDDVAEFYRHRIPVCYNIPMLSKFIKQKGGDRFLRMTEEDLSRYLPEEEELSLYPEQITLGNRAYAAVYDYEPGRETDGVTVKIPSALAATVPPDQIDWLVPGFFRDKITTLLKGLPKDIRKKLVPLPETVEIIIKEMPRKNAPLVSALGSFIYKRFGVDVPASAWPEKSLPAHLRMRIAITDNKGREVARGRDKAVLTQFSGIRASDRLTEGLQEAVANWEKTGIRKWDFGDLPESVLLKTKNGPELIAFPGLEKHPDLSQGLDLKLFLNRDEALSSHLEGVESLYRIHFSRDLKFLKKRLILPRGIAPKTLYSGGAKQVEIFLFEGVTHRLFKKNIRTEKAFYDHAASMAPGILPLGTDLLNNVIPVLEAYHDTRSLLSGLASKTGKNSPVFAFFENMRTEANNLIPQNFILLYAVDKLPDLVRYLKAMAIRITRASDNLEKDQRKAEDVKVYTDALSDLVKTLSPSTSPEKRKALEEFFYMIEEYKISIFAPEIKTAMPVSKKRLDEKLKEIERMR